MPAGSAVKTPVDGSNNIALVNAWDAAAPPAANTRPSASRVPEAPAPGITSGETAEKVPLTASYSSAGAPMMSPKINAPPEFSATSEADRIGIASEPVDVSVQVALETA